MLQVSNEPTPANTTENWSHLSQHDPGLGDVERRCHGGRYKTCKQEENSRGVNWAEAIPSHNTHLSLSVEGTSWFQRPTVSRFPDAHTAHDQEYVPVKGVVIMAVVNWMWGGPADIPRPMCTLSPFLSGDIDNVGCFRVATSEGVKLETGHSVLYNNSPTIIHLSIISCVLNPYHTHTRWEI